MMRSSKQREARRQAQATFNVPSRAELLGVIKDLQAKLDNCIEVHNQQAQLIQETQERGQITVITPEQPEAYMLGWQQAWNVIAKYHSPIEQQLHYIHSLIGRMYGIAYGARGGLANEQMMVMIKRYGDAMNNLDIMSATFTTRVGAPALNDQAWEALHTIRSAALSCATGVDDGAALRKLAEVDDGQLIALRDDIKPGAPATDEAVKQRLDELISQTETDHPFFNAGQVANHIFNQLHNSSNPVDQEIAQKINRAKSRANYIRAHKSNRRKKPA